MDLRQMFLFIVLVAFFFTIGTIIGSYRMVPRVPVLPQDAGIPRNTASRQSNSQNSHDSDVRNIERLPVESHRDGTNIATQPVESHQRVRNTVTQPVESHQDVRNTVTRPAESHHDVRNTVTRPVDSHHNDDKHIENIAPKESNNLHSNGLHKSSNIASQDTDISANNKLLQKDNNYILEKRNGGPQLEHTLIGKAALKENPGVSKVKFHQDSFILPEVNTSRYIKTFPAVQCFIEGTNMIKTAIRYNRECVCFDGWYGISCSVPEVVHTSNYPREFGVILLDRPYRIIYAMPFSHEFDLLEAKMHELYDVVDVFLILESNSSAAGKPKDRFLLNKLNAGFLSQFQDKIVYITLDFFPRGAYRDGWVIDGLLRDYIGTIGLKKILKNVRDDDIIVVNDADELPVHQTLVFLKFNAGYPQPIGFKLRHNIFGFFWQGEGDYGTSEVYGAVSIGVLRGLCRDSLYAVRSAPKRIPHGTALEDFMRKYKVRLQAWSFGLDRSPAGWHCSWCFNPEGIRAKLHYAHVSDEPRYGVIEGKDSLQYIQHLIKTGTWFDDKTKFIEVRETYLEQYAPSLFTNNEKSYMYLLYLSL